MINGLMETQEERDAAFQERMKRVEINRQHKLKEMNEPYMWDKHWQVSLIPSAHDSCGTARLHAHSCIARRLIPERREG
jgi:hypothetical protein